MRTKLHHVFRYVLMMALTLTSLLSVQSAAAQQSPPPTRQVIAHGVDELDGSSMTWQVSSRDAGTDPAAAYAETPTGFSLATNTPIVVADASAMQGDYIGPGSARFHANGTSQLVVSSNDLAATYTDISLTSSAADGGYTSNPIQTPTGNRAIQLTGGFLPAGREDTHSPENDFAYLVHVTEGAVRIVDDANATHEIATDASLTITGSITMTASADATYVIASIGPEVTVPPFPEAAMGTLTITQYDCPTGVDPTVDASTCTPVVEPWGVVIHPSGLGEDTSGDLMISEEVANQRNSWTWTEMSVGTWQITPVAVEDGEEVEVVVTGATLDGNHYNAEISSGETTEVTMYLVGERLTGEGWLDLYVYTCDTALTDAPPTETPGCVPSDAGAPSFTISRVNDQSISFTDADVTLIEPGLYRLSDLPAGSYNISFSIPEEGDMRVYGDVTQPLGAMIYGIGVPADADATVIVATGPSGDTAGEGTATFTYYICPPEAVAGDGTVDLDPLCTNTALPGEMTLTAADGTVYNTVNGSVSVPAGDYQIAALFTPAGELYVVGTVTISANQTETVYVADVSGNPSTPAP